jgi:hypothetical protein
MCRVLNFTLFPHDDKKLICGVILQPAKNLSLFVILQRSEESLFSLFKTGDPSALQPWMTNGFLIRLITIDLALE